MIFFLSVPHEEQTEETIVMTVDKLPLQNRAQVSRPISSCMNRPQCWLWRVQRPQRHLLGKANGAGSMPDSSRSSSGILELPRKPCDFFLMQNPNCVTPMHWQGLTCSDPARTHGTHQPPTLPPEEAAQLGNQSRAVQVTRHVGRP